MVRETGFQSKVESYQILKKWYLIPPCLALSTIRYGSRVKWSNSGKGVAPSPTPWCRSFRKGSFWVTFDYGRQLYLHSLISGTGAVPSHLGYSFDSFILLPRIYLQNILSPTNKTQVVSKDTIHLCTVKKHSYKTKLSHERMVCYLLLTSLL